MRLFHAPGSRSDRVLWLCEEIGAPVDLVPAALRQPTEELLALNPGGTLPVLQLDDGGVIVESVAAMLYLANRYSARGLAVDPAEPGYADYLQFTVLGEAGLTAPLSGLIMTRARAPEEADNFTTRVIADKVARQLALVERRLAGGAQFMAAGRFTVADISIASALGVVDAYLQGRVPAQLLDYRARMLARRQRTTGSI